MRRTLEEAEAIAKMKSSRVRDQVVRLLQYEVRGRREASEDGESLVALIANRNGSVILQEVG